MMNSRTSHAYSLLLLLSVLTLLGFVGGCSCSSKSKIAKQKKATTSQKPKTVEEMEAQRRKRDAEREEKPDFEILDLRVMPSDEAREGQSKPQSHIKPGHWFAAIQEVRSNNYDYPKGDLDAQCIDENVNPVKLPGGIFDLEMTRAVSLPKGQQKNIDIVLFASVPRSKTNGSDTLSSPRMYFRSRLTPRGGGRQLDWQHERAITMKGCENHFIVLAGRADNYQFLKLLPSLQPMREDFLAQTLDYHVKLPKGTQRVDLPTHSLTWSTVAYVLWDDFDPDILTLGQQQALLDWLHWGGQLIVNGPKTLDRLSASFLGEYLPARAGRTNKLTMDQLNRLNEKWAFAKPRSDDAEQEGLQEGTDGENRRAMTYNLGVVTEKDRPLCIELKLIGNGHYVENSADLVAESYVGRGCIRVSAFNLPHPVFRRWISYDSFVNACLLGRHARRFFLSMQSGDITESWKDHPRITRDDPRTTSTVRYFSRDASASVAQKLKSRRKQEDAAKQTKSQLSLDAELNGNTDGKEVKADLVHRLHADGLGTYGVNGFARDDYMGVAGWSDNSDASRLATNALRVSAGVEVPAPGFVAKVLGIYLLILVPINWICFRLMGKVEWAWAMVPLLSIGGAYGVLRATQLDIGFVRSRTEVGIIEMQPGYDRAHVTRYIGFYTSLTAPYELKGEDSSSLILPVANANETRTSRSVGLRVGDEVKMTGLSVMSQSTGMVHAEQILNVGGGIQLDGDTRIENQSNLDVQGAIVVRRVDSETVEVAKVGSLAAESKSRSLRFEQVTNELIEYDQWELEPSTTKDGEEGLNVRKLMDLASAPDRLGVGEWILVGWTDKLIPGISVKPSASQVVSNSVIVAILKHAKRISPARDANCLFDMKRQSEALRERI